MTYSDYVLSVPPGIRLLISLVVVVGITLLCLKLFYRPIIALQQPAEKTEEDAPEVPPPHDLAGRIIALTTTAFVFFSAFALNNFWGSTKAADAAVQSEVRTYNSAAALVRHIEDHTSREAALAALADYASSIRDVETGLLQQADTASAYPQHLNAGLKVSDALVSARAIDPAKSAVWDSVNSQVTDMLTYGEERVRALPGTGSSTLIWLIIVLGLLNLGLLTVFQPTFFRRNMVLIGLAAGITTLLLFVVIEVSNPYIGAAAVHAGLAGGHG